MSVRMVVIQNEISDRTDFIIVFDHGSKEAGKVLERKIKKQAGLKGLQLE